MPKLDMPRPYSGQTPASPVSNPPSIPMPEVKAQYDNLTDAIGAARGQLDLLEERLGYVTTPVPGSYSDVVENSPQPSRSPLAHNLFCAANDVNGLEYRLQILLASLEI